MQEVITIRVGRDVKERLESLAKATARSRSFLVAEAIRCYLGRPPAQGCGLKHGYSCRDLQAGFRKVLGNTYPGWGTSIFGRTFLEAKADGAW